MKDVKTMQKRIKEKYYVYIEKQKNPKKLEYKRKFGFLIFYKITKKEYT